MSCRATVNREALKHSRNSRPRGESALKFQVLSVALVCAAVVWVFGCENPQPPELCGSVPEQTLTVGESVTVDLCFDDPNGEMLDHRVVSSDPAVATAVATGNTVTTTAVSPGVALVTMIVTDPTGLKAQQNFRVVVPNRSPTAVGTIPDREVTVGDSATINVSAYFSEPDGQVLGYAAAVSDSSRLAATVEGAVLTVVAVAKGDIIVTVTATDPGGLSATQSFVLTVPNRPPVAVDSIAARIVDAGSADTVEVAPFFTDPDGDSLSYAAAVSDSTPMSAEVTGSAVIVTALAKGEAEVTVTATDDEGLSAEQRFMVAIPNRAPQVADKIAARTLFKDEADTLALARFFTDPDGDSLSYAAAVSDSTLMSAEVTGSAVIVTALAKGEAEVTVTATDDEGLSAVQRFRVAVPNRAPQVADKIAARTLFKDEADTLALARFFTDPDGDALSWSAETSNNGVVGFEVSAAEGTLAITAVRQGEATVTVTARDADGGEASQSFGVTVPNREPTAARALPAQVLTQGQSATVDVSMAFIDPDGDPLAFRAASSDTAVVRASVAGAGVTLEARRRGTVTVTVTARDAHGGEANQSFGVTVPNREPTVERALPAQVLAQGQSATVDVSTAFIDPDGDPLAFRAASSDTAVVRASVAGAGVTLEARRRGTVTVTVTARDAHGGEASQSFGVTVEHVPPPPPTNRAPVVTSAMPDLSAAEGDTLSVAGGHYFSDPDGDDLSFTGTSSNPSVATVGGESSTMLRVAATSRGTTEITVTARDPGGLTHSQSFTLTVVTAYRPPEATGKPPDLITVPGATEIVGVDSYFRGSLLGARATYSASSSHPEVAVATAHMDATLGTYLEVTGVALGEATMTITVEDERRETAETGFLVSVVANRKPRVTRQIEGRYVKVGHSISWDLSTYFSDDGPLIYTVSVGPPADRFSSYPTADVSQELTGASLTIKGVSTGGGSLGLVSVTVTATDDHGESASQSFPFIVTTAS